MFVDAVEEQKVLHSLRVCSLMYPACNASAPYCHRWPALLCNIFPQYLKTAQISKKEKVTENNKMSVSSFSTTSVSNISHFKKN